MQARLPTAVAAGLAIVTVAWFALDPPANRGWWAPHPDRNAVPLLSGQLALIAIWSAIATTSWRLRWAGAAAAFWLTAQPAGLTEANSVWWQLYLSWIVLPTALLNFTALCITRELGLRIVPRAATPSHARSAQQFNLRAIFTWVAGAAVLSFAWKHVLMLESLRDVALQGVFVAFSARIADPVITLVAIWATLRPKPLRWSMAGLIVAVIVLQTAAFYTIHNAYPLWGGGVRTWQKSFALICEGDPLYLGPLIGTLLLARAAGYRLVLVDGRGDNGPSTDRLDSAG